MLKNINWKRIIVKRIPPAKVFGKEFLHKNCIIKSFFVSRRGGCGLNYYSSKGTEAWEDLVERLAIHPADAHARALTTSHSRILRQPAWVSCESPHVMHLYLYAVHALKPRTCLIYSWAGPNLTSGLAASRPSSSDFTKSDSYKASNTFLTNFRPLYIKYSCKLLVILHDRWCSIPRK